MYGKRYFRLLMVVVVLFTVLLLVLLSSDYQISEIVNTQRAKFSSNINQNNIKESTTIELLQGLLPSYLKQEKSGSLISNFPLNSSLLDDGLYSDISMRTYTDPFPYIDDKPNDYVFEKSYMCESLKFESTFKVSKQEYLNADFEKIQSALSENEHYSALIKNAKEKFKPTIPDEKQWFRFGGSSVWLPEYNLHFMVSRVLYTPSGIPNKAFASFLYVQLFDIGWKEIPKLKLTIPYEQNVVQNILNSDGSSTEIIVDKTIAYRDVTYPSFLQIPFDFYMHVDSEKYYWGPEDPRILIRRNPLGFDEPLVVFNMKSNKLTKRVMHLYLPFSNKLQILRKRSEPFAYIEKNWTPFISKNKNTTAEDGISKLNFIYSIVPLEILTCEIDTAICDFLQKPEKNDYNYIGPLRGGTQLVELPFTDLIPDHVKEKFKLPDDRKVFLGWARAHLNKCGCGESMYRPNMIILIEDYNPNTNKFYYKLGDVSEYFDFNAYVPPWTTPKFDEQGNLVETNPKQCEGRDVLIPNSIAYWDVESIVKDNTLYSREHFNKIATDDVIADKKAGKVTKYETKRKRDLTYSQISFNDYMGVTLSAADSDVSIIHVKGLLNSILRLPALFDEATVVKDDNSFQQIGYDFNNICAMAASEDYCVQYAEKNGGLTQY